MPHHKEGLSLELDHAAARAVVAGHAQPRVDRQQHARAVEECDLGALTWGGDVLAERGGVGKDVPSRGARRDYGDRGGDAERPWRSRRRRRGTSRRVKPLPSAGDVPRPRGVAGPPPRQPPDGAELV